MRIPQDASPDVQQSFMEVHEKLDDLLTGNINLSGRRIINAGRSRGQSDYVTRAEIAGASIAPATQIKFVGGGGGGGGGIQLKGLYYPWGASNLIYPLRLTTGPQYTALHVESGISVFDGHIQIAGIGTAHGHRLDFFDTGGLEYYIQYDSTSGPGLRIVEEGEAERLTFSDADANHDIKITLGLGWDSKFNCVWDGSEGRRLGMVFFRPVASKDGIAGLTGGELEAGSPHHPYGAGISVAGEDAAGAGHGGDIHLLFGGRGVAPPTSAKCSVTGCHSDAYYYSHVAFFELTSKTAGVIRPDWNEGSSQNVKMDVDLGSSSFPFQNFYGKKSILSDAVTAPSAIASYGQIFIDSSDGKLKIRKSTGDGGGLVSLEDAGGDVSGPGAATDKAIARFDGISGKVIQNYSGYAPTISDTGELYVPSAGPHAFGGATADNIQLWLHGNFTSGGSSNSVVGMYNSTAITAANGDTNLLAGTWLTSSITTQSNSETIGKVAQLYIDEPDITVGTDTITFASSLHIAGAPTEASNNYAVFVDSGAVRIDDQLLINYANSPSSKVHMAGTFANASGAGCYGIANSIDLRPLAGTNYNAMYAAGSTFGASIASAGTGVGHTFMTTMYLSEPNITLNGDDTVTYACTLYIQNAPTEGSKNYAVFVDSGNCRFDGGMQIFGTLVESLSSINDEAIELFATGSNMYVQAFNRSTSTWHPLYVRANPLYLCHNTTAVASADSGGLNLQGSAAATSYRLDFHDNGGLEYYLDYNSDTGPGFRIVEEGGLARMTFGDQDGNYDNHIQISPGNDTKYQLMLDGPECRALGMIFFRPVASKTSVAGITGAELETSYPYHPYGGGISIAGEDAAGTDYGGDVHVLIGGRGVTASQMATNNCKFSVTGCHSAGTYWFSHLAFFLLKTATSGVIRPDWNDGYSWDAIDEEWDYVQNQKMSVDLGDTDFPFNRAVIKELQGEKDPSGWQNSIEIFAGTSQIGTLGDMNPSITGGVGISLGHASNSHKGLIRLDRGSSLTKKTPYLYMQDSNGNWHYCYVNTSGNWTVSGTEPT